MSNDSARAPTIDLDRQKLEIEKEKLKIEEMKLEIERGKLKFIEDDIGIKRKDQRRSKWSLAVQAIGIFGAIVTVIVGYIQYLSNSDKDTRENLIKAMQFTELPAHKAFIENLKKLYSQVEPARNPGALEYYNSRSDSAKAFKYFKDNVVDQYRMEFDNTLIYFNLMEAYAKAGPCYAKAVQISLAGEAILFWWYFKPIFYEYLKIKALSWDDLYGSVDRIARQQLVPHPSGCSS